MASVPAFTSGFDLIAEVPATTEGALRARRRAPEQRFRGGRAVHRKSPNRPSHIFMRCVADVSQTVVPKRQLLFALLVAAVPRPVPTRDLRIGTGGDHHRLRRRLNEGCARTKRAPAYSEDRASVEGLALQQQAFLRRSRSSRSRRPTMVSADLQSMDYVQRRSSSRKTGASICSGTGWF